MSVQKGLQQAVSSLRKRAQCAERKVDLLGQLSRISEDDIAEAIVSSTKASFGGSKYVLELCCDTYRFLWSENIGNQYDSPGLLVGVITLTDEDWGAYEESLDPDCCWDFDFDEYIEEFKDCVRESVNEEEYLSLQGSD